MTIREVANQIYGLTGGRINGEQYTKQETLHVFAMWARNMEHNKIVNRHVISVTLPDGEWLATIDKAGGEYGYTIPENRAQEQQILFKLMEV